MYSGHGKRAKRRPLHDVLGPPTEPPQLHPNQLCRTICGSPPPLLLPELHPPMKSFFNSRKRCPNWSHPRPGSKDLTATGVLDHICGPRINMDTTLGNPSHRPSSLSQRTGPGNRPRSSRHVRRTTGQDPRPGTHRGWLVGWLVGDGSKGEKGCAPVIGPGHEGAARSRKTI